MENNIIFCMCSLDIMSCSINTSRSRRERQSNGGQELRPMVEQLVKGHISMFTIFSF